MASLDTNVLVRLLVKDDERQAAQARKLVQAESDRGGKTLFSYAVRLFASSGKFFHGSQTPPRTRTDLKPRAEGGDGAVAF